MNQQNLRPVRISLLNIIAFLGLVAHMLMFSTVTSVKIVEGLAKGSQDLLPIIKDVQGVGFLWMIVVYIALSLVPAFLPLISVSKASRWIIAILGGLIALMNILDGCGHIFMKGEVPQGLATLIISGGVGITASVIAFKWARDKSNENIT